MGHHIFLVVNVYLVDFSWPYVLDVPFNWRIFLNIKFSLMHRMGLLSEGIFHHKIL